MRPFMTAIVTGLFLLSVTNALMAQSVPPRYSHGPSLYLLKQDNLVAPQMRQGKQGLTYRYHLGLFDYQPQQNPALRLTEQMQDYTYERGLFQYHDSDVRQHRQAH